MKCLIVILSVFISSCGLFNKSEKYVEPEIREHVEKFKLIYGLQINIEIKFKNLDPTTAGVCYYYEGNPEDNYIEIDKETFQEYSELGREELIFHELGHCVFNRDHTTERMMFKGISVPTSIMYPYTFGNSWIYEQNLTHYYSELVEGKK